MWLGLTVCMVGSRVDLVESSTQLLIDSVWWKYNACVRWQNTQTASRSVTRIARVEGGGWGLFMVISTLGWHTAIRTVYGSSLATGDTPPAPPYQNISNNNKKIFWNVFNPLLRWYLLTICCWRMAPWRYLTRTNTIHTPCGHWSSCGTIRDPN